jgi:hypothetical protein
MVRWVSALFLFVIGALAFGEARSAHSEMDLLSIPKPGQHRHLIAASRLQTMG